MQGEHTMNDKQIASFLSVAKCGSFSSATRQQFISPQAMIQQIDLLEKEIGVKLLHRTHQGVMLTRAGQQFYDGMERISREITSMLNSIRNAENRRLRISFFSSSPMMSKACESFSMRYPDIRQEYILAEPEAWLEDLKQLCAGELDLFEHADVPQVHENGLDFVPLVRDPIVCTLSPIHPLADRAVIFPEDLAGLRVGIHDISCIPGLQEFLQTHAPEVELIDGNKGPVSAFDICENGGVFLCSESFSEKNRPLRIAPLACDFAWIYGLAFRKNPDPLVQLFIDNAKAQFAPCDAR